MKKEESIMGIFSLVIGLVSILTMRSLMGMALAWVALALAIPTFFQKEKRKSCGIVGVILSLIVLFVWYLLPPILVIWLT